jgi:hypothetical protein
MVWVETMTLVNKKVDFDQLYKEARPVSGEFLTSGV